MLSNDRTRNYIKYIDKIGHYSHNNSTDMICLDMDNNKILVEIEYKLSNLFKHDHPYDTFDYVVCWNVDLEAYEKKRLIDGCSLTLMREEDEWILKYGAQKVIPIIELKEIVAKIETELKEAIEA